MRELPPEERPREKLLRYGAARLESRDLLAILLGTGTRALSALSLADRLLARFGSLEQVLAATVEELSQTPGVGFAKAAQIVAAAELGRRSCAERRSDAPVTCAEDVVAWVRPHMEGLEREEVWALLLDAKHRVKGVRVVAVGHLSGAPVHPREVFKEAIRCSSAAVVLAHNHPSGDPTPSPSDIALTKRLREAGELLGIPVLDHVVLGDGCHTSLKEQGYW